MVIVEKGRTVNERSAVLVENGVYKGYTFYDLNYQITNIEILKTYSFRCKTTVIPNIIQAYKKNKGFKIINL
jgi:DNA polymerase-3 subunit epsilon